MDRDVLLGILVVIVGLTNAWVGRLQRKGKAEDIKLEKDARNAEFQAARQAASVEAERTLQGFAVQFNHERESLSRRLDSVQRDFVQYQVESALDRGALQEQVRQQDQKIVDLQAELVAEKASADRKERALEKRIDKLEQALEAEKQLRLNAEAEVKRLKTMFDTEQKVFDYEPESSPGESSNPQLVSGNGETALLQLSYLTSDDVSG